MVIFFCSQTSCSQQVNNKRENIMKENDLKFWYSQEQLENNICLAMLKGTPMRRLYIDDIEFTESGYVKVSDYKDSKFIIRIDINDINYRIKVVEVDPKEVKIKPQTPKTEIWGTTYINYCL